MSDVNGNEANFQKEAEMTDQEQALADDKMRAEIAKLIEETSKIFIERAFYPFVAGAAFFAAIAAFVKIFL